MDVKEFKLITLTQLERVAPGIQAIAKEYKFHYERVDFDIHISESGTPKSEWYIALEDNGVVQSTVKKRTHKEEFSLMQWGTCKDTRATEMLAYIAGYIRGALEIQIMWENF